MTTLYREQWEEPGYRISEHTGSPPVNASELLYTVNHYPAVTSITTNDPAVWFRNVQRGYVLDPRRGYSIGYSWGYWPDGTEVECRGWDFRNAANDVADDPPPAEDENRVSLSFLIVVTGLAAKANPATTAQIEAVQERIAEIHRRCGRNLANIVHGDLEPTMCAGAGINTQTRAGVFLPPSAPPPAPKEAPEMILIRVEASPNDWAGFSQDATGIVRWIPNGREWEAWLASGAIVANIPPAEFQTIISYTRTMGRINPAAARITGVSESAWTARGML